MLGESEEAFLARLPSPRVGKGAKTGGSSDYADSPTIDYACDYADRPTCDHADSPGGAIRLKSRILAVQQEFELDSRGQTYTQRVVTFT